MLRFRKKEKEIDGNEIRESKTFKEAEIKAKDYIESPEKLNTLVDSANKKAKKKRSSLKDVWGSLMASFRLVKAYSNGTYRDIPWQSLVLIIAALIYFVMPVDLIPDIVAVAGYLDDATLLAWTLGSVSKEIDRYKEWESA